MSLSRVVSVNSRAEIRASLSTLLSRGFEKILTRFAVVTVFARSKNYLFSGGNSQCISVPTVCWLWQLTRYKPRAVYCLDYGPLCWCLVTCFFWTSGVADMSCQHGDSSSSTRGFVFRKHRYPRLMSEQGRTRVTCTSEGRQRLRYWIWVLRNLKLVFHSRSKYCKVSGIAIAYSAYLSVWVLRGSRYSSGSFGQFSSF